MTCDLCNREILVMEKILCHWLQLADKSYVYILSSCNDCRSEAHMKSREIIDECYNEEEQGMLEIRYNLITHEIDEIKALFCLLKSRLFTSKIADEDLQPIANYLLPIVQRRFNVRNGYAQVLWDERFHIWFSNGERSDKYEYLTTFDLKDDTETFLYKLKGEENVIEL